MNKRITIIVFTCLILSLLLGTIFANKLMILKYDVSINDFSAGIIDIELEINNVIGSKLEIKEYGYNGFVNEIIEFDVYDKDNNSLSYKQYYHPDDVSFGTNGRRWIIDTESNSTIIIKYKSDKNVLLNDQYRGYLGDGYGILTGEQIFVYPTETNNISDDIEVRFNLPENAPIYSTWKSEDNIYYPNRDFDYGDETVVENLVRSNIAMGDFISSEKLIGDSTIKVVVPSTYESESNDYFENIFILYEYYSELFGKSLNSDYLYIYMPETHDKKYVHINGYSTTQAMSKNNGFYSYTHTGHGFFHRWNGWLWGWNVDDKLGRLLMEGNNRYYEAKSIINSFENMRSYDIEEIRYLEGIYTTYKEKYIDSNIIYSEAESYPNVEDREWIMYAKGALIWFALDMKMMEDTGGKYSVDDLMELLDDRSGRSGEYITYEKLLDMIKSFTNEDYSKFFDDYVFDTKVLDLDRYFEDTDSDGLLNYIEIIRGLDINVKEVYNIELSSHINPGGVSVQGSTLVVGSRISCDSFKNATNQFTLSYLSGIGEKDVVDEVDVVVWLTHNNINTDSVKSLFSDMNLDYKNYVNIKKKGDKLLVYVKGESDTKLQECIKKLEDLDLSIEQTYSFDPKPDVDVYIPEFDVNVNGMLIDTKHSEYPVITYNNITYFPMTSDYLSGIGLDLSFSTEDGLAINVKEEIFLLEQNFLGSDNILGSSKKAKVPPLKIKVNEKQIINNQEEYPILLYKDITYFPMTWRFAVTEFGWKTEWSDEKGFSIIIEK